jgi:replicative DNA helicase
MEKNNNKELSQLLNGPPPWDESAEISCLAALMGTTQQLHLVCDTVTAEDFFSDPHRILFEEICNLRMRRANIDPTILLSHLKKIDKDDKVGGFEVLHRIFDQIDLNAPHALFYAEIVRDYSTERKTINALHDGLRAMYGREGELSGRLARIVSDIFGTQEERLRGEVSDMPALVSDFEERLAEGPLERAKRVEPTGFIDLDRLLSGGLRKNQLIVIASRPGVGKTSLGLNIAANLGRVGKRTLMYSFEMSSEEIIDRMISSLSKINLNSIKRNELTAEMDDRVTKACATVAQIPLTVVSGGGYTVNDVALQTRAMQASKRDGIDLLLVDYLQLMLPNPSQTRRTDSREREVASMSRQLKQIAMDSGLPVVCCCQLNRMATHDRPRLHHLRESGAIEQDADVVIFIDKKEHADNPVLDEYELIVAKQRNGSVGKFPIIWDGATTTFLDASLQNPEDAPFSP